MQVDMFISDMNKQLEAKQDQKDLLNLPLCRLELWIIIVLRSLLAYKIKRLWLNLNTSSEVG